ncbi:hypothetical protein [Sphingomonas pseudosanguinis]|uniref:Uncharacterized protein n=1 Tax=Sphingomonas pseudosanguinis TaxID=413712 RepID=A0A7W6AAX5_9SPHN|nr:hypothetical protein [Sphingomonas pseudosanguinis]MBB3880476.1 hypothetical protein [Sphingomonas pseudosanguinis]MBN3537313.1 hypothetical protein [Sphingomonas pseudosanguinis]
MSLPLAGTMVGWAVAGVVAGMVLGGTGIGLLLRRRRDRRVGSPEDVAAAAEAALSGFTVSGAVVGADGQGALAVATDGRVAAIKLQGRVLAVREIPWTRVRSTTEGIIAEVEGRFGPVTLAGVDVLDIRRLKA